MIFDFLGLFLGHRVVIGCVILDQVNPLVPQLAQLHLVLAVDGPEQFALLFGQLEGFGHQHDLVGLKVLAKEFHVGLPLGDGIRNRRQGHDGQNENYGDQHFPVRHFHSSRFQDPNDRIDPNRSGSICF